MGEEIILDKELLKAIGADTRISILKSLYEHQKTQTDLAKELSLSVPTILEHLSQLETARLVQKIEEGRKWKYYVLTPKGKQLISSSKKKTSINTILILGIFIIFIIGAIMNSPLIQKNDGASNLQNNAFDSDTSSKYSSQNGENEELYTETACIDCINAENNQTNLTNSTRQKT